MAIKKFYVNTPKPGYQYDAKAKKYFSWGIDIWLGGRRLQERGFQTKEEAEAAVAELKRRERGGRLGIMLTAQVPYLIELFQRKLDDMDQGPDRARAKRVFTYFLEMLPVRMKVPELRTAHLQKYVERRQRETDARTGRPITNQTIRRELVPIVSALKSGYKYFEALDDYHPPRIPRPRVEKAQKERVISKEEQDGLFAFFFADRKAEESKREFETRSRTGQFLLFCLLTLSRPGEIAALRRGDVDLAAGIVSVRGTKTRFRSTQSIRRLSITSTMRQVLEERLKSTSGEYLFTKAGYVTPSMYEHMKTACESIGVEYGRTDKQAISFHTARHTGITMLLQAGVDLKTVGRIAGHSDAKMTMYYTHASPELVNRAAEILEQKMGKGASIHFGQG